MRLVAIIRQCVIFESMVVENAHRKHIYILWLKQEILLIRRFKTDDDDDARCHREKYTRDISNADKV